MLAASSVHETERLVSFTLVELLAILIAARISGKIANWLGQPRVVGEIVGGLLLGPSLFGRLFPNQFEFVFHSISPVSLIILSQIGLCLLMFQIGLEFNFSHLKEKQNRTAVIAVSIAGIALPFALGWLVGAWSHATLAPDVNLLGYCLFLAVALSITAIPILGRIMMELGITRTAFRTAQQPRPIRNGHSRAMLRDVVGHPVITGFAPYDKPDVRSERRAQRDALRLAFAALHCHIQVNAPAGSLSRRIRRSGTPCAYGDRSLSARPVLLKQA